MRIDWLKNPLGIVRRYKIPYAEGLHLEAQIRGLGEEGIDGVNWFEGSVRYSKNQREIGGTQFDRAYKALKRGVATIGEMETMLRNWCDSMGIRISDAVESDGVIA